MQARRTPSPSLSPPSSPPSAAQRFGVANSPREAISPTQTLWTAPSPTRTLGHSSPELPPLPSFSTLGSNPRTPSAAARNERTDTSYYTASWGSPYRHPPPVFNTQRQVSTNFGSDDFEGDSSTLQFGLGHLLPSRFEAEEESPNRFNLEHLIPRLDQNASPVQFTLEHLIRSRVPIPTTPTKESQQPATTPRPSDPNPTSAEWVQKFLERRWNREANDWRSDDSVETDKESIEEQEIPLEAPPKRGHKVRNANKTLNQQDFWRHFSKDQKDAIGKMMASKYAVSDAGSQSRQVSGGGPSEKQAANGRENQAENAPISPSTLSPTGPSTLPAETPSKLTEGVSSRQAPLSADKPLPNTPTKHLAPPEPVRAPTQRARKKVMVKGKGCIISIPRDIPRGTPGFPPKPLSVDAVNAKLRQLEQDGYDTRGFSTGGLQPHNRAIWPAEADIQAERANAKSQYRVRVSKKAEWEQYTASLLEAKLAALGVSVGGEEDVPLPMSRSASGQQHPGQLFSPPLPTSSAGSHRMARQGSIVSGSFPFGPSPGHMSRQSIASPGAFTNPRMSMHMHRHSTFGSPASFAHQRNSPSGAWSPGNYFGPQDGRTASPALPFSRADMSGILSPASPFGMRPGPQFPPTPTQQDDYLMQMQMQQQQLQAQLLQQQQQQVMGMRPNSTLAEVPEDEDEEDELPAMKHVNGPAPEIAVPTPRHRHNISENLEREAADAEYHLEEAIDKQFAEGGDFSTEPDMKHQYKSSNSAANKPWEDSRTILHQPQPHSRAHSLAKSQQPVAFSFPAQNPRGENDGAKTNGSDVTNPSLEEGEVQATVQSSAQHSKAPSQVSNSWKDNKFAFSKPASAIHSKHTSRSSISKLNVEAKEFKFNPAASFSPGSFSSGFTFAPAVKSPAEVVAPHSNKSSINEVSSFNVTAPAFTPDAPTFKPDAPAVKPVAEILKSAVEVPEFKPTGATFPSSGFNFSSPPTFKPDAPVFDPKVSAFNPNKPVPAPTSFSSKIFGDVNLSANDIVKPASRSKAVPIVRPDLTQQTSENEEEGREDEEGRPMQADGREKRARRGRADGDEVPKFALQPILPSQPVAQVQKVMDELDLKPEDLPEDKENLSPDGKRAKSKSKSPEPLSLQKEASPPKSSKPAMETEQLSDPLDDDQTPDASDVPTPTIEEPAPHIKKHGHKSSTLSANAKPFEFKPQFGAGYDFGFHVTKPSQTQEPAKRQATPARDATESPATTFRPSDDGSFKTAFEGGRRVRYPDSESVDFDQLGGVSFNDIDAVMKHMNEEGSDFGIERDENSWDHSSPPQRTHEFDERSDLQPNFKMRSDAPSPSPRRLFAARNMQPGSATSGQDPFDDERAALVYDSPVHRLNNADDVPISDWDEGLLTDGEDKVQTRSRFFDQRVDDIMGRLLESRLGPLEQNLQGIQDALATLSHRPGRGRRSMSTAERDSDADDEDDDSGEDAHFRNRSPRKDRRLEKMRAIVRDALESHQLNAASLSAPVTQPMDPETIREIIADVLAAHQPTAAPVQNVPTDQVRAIIEEVVASHKPVAPEPVVQPVNSDDIRAIVMDAFATHAPQPMPAPVPEQIWPDDLKAIVAEALAAQQQQTPASELLRPEMIRSIVTEALSAHQPPALPAIMEPVEPDMIRSIVAESLASNKPTTLEAPVDIPQPQVDMSEIYQVVGSLKAAIAQTTNHQLKAEDVRELVDDALKRQSVELAAREEAQAIQEKDARIADLEAMLKEAALRANEEAEARAALEAREADAARLLKVTEEELALLQQAASQDETKIQVLTEDRDVARSKLDAFLSGDDDMRHKLSAMDAENEELRLKNVALESSEEDLREKLKLANAENEALSSTLEEHRFSASKWRTDVQHAHEESEQLRRAMDQARYQAEEAARVRESMRTKFEKLQQDMVAAAQQVAAERAQWHKNEESSATKYEILSARIEAEGRTRERLERELERLETQEREGMKLRIHLEQTQKHNARLEETIDQLKNESMEHQKNAERYERDMREARDAAHVEIRRTRVLMEADIDAANNQVNIVRHDLESQNARVRAELDQVRLDADTAQEKHELDLEAASDAKKQAVHEALESKRHSLQEQQRTFERQLEHIKQEHTRALNFAREDRERTEAFHNDKLALADSKADHLKDKIALLEEKLQVAKEAAQAAAAAAGRSPTFASSSSAPSGQEKISPQALRESIAVLQDQLQEREQRIEALEHEMEGLDTEAPAKLKERDTEINWLRELLGVRIDDLNDLINSLAQPTFDRETVRDAAIRIRTNLQMEQSEKERLISGGSQSFPTLSTLSNFASPKAVQLAAAFGNWRNKGRGEAASALAGNSNTTSRTQTPSRATPHSAQSFLSGLMTPPTSNLRRTPELPSSSSRPQNQRSSSISSKASTEMGFPGLGSKMNAVPQTPPLMRKANYDQDAEVEQFSESGFYDDESIMEGEMTPIALNFGRELQRENSRH
jgi:hypothetical protein